MSTNADLQRTNEWEKFRGFSNLFRKETASWWGTRRWWINALFWTLLLCGLMAIMLFAPSEAANQPSAAEIAQAGGSTAYVLSLALSVFFEFGGPMLAIGTVIFAQDLILPEKQNGLIEWLLSKPLSRRAYILAKIAANAPALLILLVGLPAAVAYGLLSLRTGAPFPLSSFLFSVYVLTLHTLFYLTLTLMLGTLFNNRAPILGIALGSVLGGGLVGGFIKPLFSVTPWMLPKLAWMMTTSQAVPAEWRFAPLLATTLWILVFIFVALVKFERMEC